MNDINIFFYIILLMCAPAVFKMIIYTMIKLYDWTQKKGRGKKVK